MALQSLGSQSSDRPTTPTLRQFHKRANRSPNRSHVKTIFRPGKLPYWTFITDHDFKVVVQEDNPLHAIITEGVESWSKDSACLIVVVEDGEKGHWSLSLDTDDNSSWQEKGWGYVLSDYAKGKRRKTH